MESALNLVVFNAFHWHVRALTKSIWLWFFHISFKLKWPKFDLDEQHFSFIYPSNQSDLRLTWLNNTGKQCDIKMVWSAPSVLCGNGKCLSFITELLLHYWMKFNNTLFNCLVGLHKCVKVLIRLTLSHHNFAFHPHLGTLLQTLFDGLKANLGYGFGRGLIDTTIRFVW